MIWNFNQETFASNSVFCYIKHNIYCPQLIAQYFLWDPSFESDHISLCYHELFSF
jgi:hypothetical protein